MNTTIQIRLCPTPAQAALLRAHCQEYISTINVLVQALDADILPDKASTKDFRASLPSAVKNQALRDARAVWKRACDLGVIPILQKPICQWNNQNWRLEGASLLLPVYQDGQVNQIAIRCAPVFPVSLDGALGMLRITRKRGKWIADIALTLPKPEPTTGEAIMGIDLGIKVPAVVHIIGKGTRFFGNGRHQRFKRRQFYSQRRSLHQAGKVCTVKQRQGKERRWMRDVNHQLSRQIVTHAQQQGVGVIRLERLAGIRRHITQHPSRTARTSRGAKRHHAARKNNRMKNTWPFFQLTQFITYKAERLGIRVEQVDPAYTSQTCPACFEKNTAADRRYVCSECGWHGHRDSVGAINIARKTPDTGQHGHSAGATIAIGSDGGRVA